MDKIVKASAALAALLVSSATLAATATIQPGYYENRVTVVQDGTSEVTHDCVKPGEAQTVEQLAAEITQDRECRYSRRNVGGGRIDIAATCVGTDGSRSTFTQVGTYTPTSLNVKMGGFVTYAGQKVDIGMTIASRRIAATCPRGSN